MLTKQHQFAATITQPRARQSYKIHMCGLCHALGDNYGLPHRLLTSYEMTLLNLLVTAQRQEELNPVERRCPLNPRRTVLTNQDSASEFAAAVAVQLAGVSLADNLQDRAGWNLSARFLSWGLRRSRCKALGKLRTFNFEVESVSQLADNQRRIEEDETQNATLPTAAASAGLFMMTARLAHHSQNEATLARLGACYGTYLYLADAYHDYAEDMVHGQYNPLRRFSLIEHDRFRLSAEGVRWLRHQLETVQYDIHSQVEQLHLYRDKALIIELICRPIDHLVETLKKAQAPSFKTWKATDLLKAAFFITPVIPLLFAANPLDNPAGKPRRRKSGAASSTSSQAPENSYNNSWWAGCESFDCGDRSSSEHNNCTFCSIGPCGDHNGSSCTVFQCDGCHGGCIDCDGCSGCGDAKCGD